MKNKLTIQQAKLHVESLLGKRVNVKLNKGRNKIVHCKGVVTHVYENVFERSIVSRFSLLWFDWRSFCY